MHLRLRKCKKSPQTYRKLADLRLRNTSCSFAEFAVAELSLNLRCPALLATTAKRRLSFISTLSSRATLKTFAAFNANSLLLSYIDRQVRDASFYCWKRSRHILDPRNYGAFVCQIIKQHFSTNKKGLFYKHPISKWQHFFKKHSNVFGQTFSPHQEQWWIFKIGGLRQNSNKRPRKTDVAINNCDQTTLLGRL